MTENEHHSSLWKWLWSAGIALAFVSSVVLIIVLAYIDEEIALILRVAHGIIIQNEPKVIFIRGVFVWIFVTVVIRIFIENDEENDDA